MRYARSFGCSSHCFKRSDDLMFQSM